ncbi:mannonate dehydratase [Terrihalobacillus insolitus]|uniref:mannonate dehydratase n=1 Tax=Terrihalobacillus insolitus TaxID=2950438 RepID=UPI002341B24A|nr:mannonate dehydratase [Terrihalobacillus insolitus]MDC3415154.1 mannonate dehydratase [Terrihalobacillus insolitus]
MKMTFRWYGEGNDSISLSHIKQIPGVEGIVWALHGFPIGEIWPLDKIKQVKAQADQYGFNVDVVESVNVHEDIKLGLPTRDKYIENYKETIRNLAKVGVKVICYNFMPVIEWVRTNLRKEMDDGSTALFYEREKVEKLGFLELINLINQDNRYTMPGYEPEKFGELTKLIDSYKDFTEDDLFNNLEYFLDEIIPVAEENDIKMGIHPDDPPWSVFGLQRIVTDKKKIRRILELYDSPSNGLTLCTGSLGSNLNNNVVEITKEFADRIVFAHIRNVNVSENGDFIETSHRTNTGSVDIYGVVEALHRSNFTGYIRPDHGRHIWGEDSRPGYGLYDRALGVMYLLGIWDSLEIRKTTSSIVTMYEVESN